MNSTSTHNRPVAIAKTLVAAFCSIGAIATGFYLTFKIIVWLQT